MKFRNLLNEDDNEVCKEIFKSMLDMVEINIKNSHYTDGQIPEILQGVISSIDEISLDSSFRKYAIGEVKKKLSKSLGVPLKESYEINENFVTDFLEKN